MSMATHVVRVEACPDSIHHVLDRPDRLNNTHEHTIQQPKPHVDFFQVPHNDPKYRVDVFVRMADGQEAECHL
jgi:hypothetical protein